MLTFTSQNVTLDKIVTGRNVRLPSQMKVEELAADIHDNGLLTPLTGWMMPNGSMLVIAGHRRTSALRMIQAQEPEHFKSLFPKGIPVTVAQGITETEAEAMKVDHGNELGLSDPMEVQLCANLLFAQNLSEKQVVIRLAGLMDRVKPMKSDMVKKYKTMLADAELWKTKGNLTEAKSKQAEAETFLFNYRRGYVQNLHRAYRCPNVVLAALYFKATGERPDKDSGFGVDEKELLPSGLTYDHVKKLFAAFEKDMTIEAKGAKVYNKLTPGPDFLNKWAEIVAELTKKASDSENQVVRAKAMSAGEMEQELKEAKWASRGFQLLTKHHRKDSVDMSALAACDQLAYTAELLSERAPDEWKTCLTLAAAIQKEMIEATKQAPVEPKAPKKATGGKQK